MNNIGLIKLILINESNRISKNNFKSSFYFLRRNHTERLKIYDVYFFILLEFNYWYWFEGGFYLSTDLHFVFLLFMQFLKISNILLSLKLFHPAVLLSEFLYETDILILFFNWLFWEFYRFVNIWLLFHNWSLNLRNLQILFSLLFDEFGYFFVIDI